MRRMDLGLALVIALVPVAACGGDEPRPVVPASHIPVPPLPSPDDSSEAPPAPKLSLAEMQTAAVAEALAALNGHDAKRFASMYAEDAVISVTGLNEVSGRPAIEQNMAEWFETFKDVRLGFSRVWAKGETLVLEWVINGKHHGELFGVKGTEQPIGHYGLSVVTFDGNGKVSREHRYSELGTVMSQVGGAKAKSRPIPSIPESPERFTSSGTPDEEKNLELAKALFASLEPGKKEADFLGLLSEDIEQQGLVHLTMSKGKASAKSFYKAFTTAFPDAKFATKNALAVGDYVIVESVLEATHKGRLGTLAPTKRPISIHLADVFHVKDGSIARAWTYQNSLELEEQLGLFKVPAAGAIPASQRVAAGPAAPAKKEAGKAAEAMKEPAATGGGGKGTGGGGGKGTGGGGGKGTGGGEHGKKQ